jgi:hypothetical protein
VLDKPGSEPRVGKSYWPERDHHDDDITGRGLPKGENGCNEQCANEKFHFFCAVSSVAFFQHGSHSIVAKRATRATS